MANNVTFDRPIQELDNAPKQKRIHWLKKDIPYMIRTADEDCRMIARQYRHIIDGEHWRDVANSAEEYFVKFCDHPIEWFEKLLEGIELLDQSQPIKTQDALDAVELKNTKRPDNLRQKSPETIEKAKRAQKLRAEGWTQQAIADKLDCTRQYVAGTLLATNTSYNVTSITCDKSDTNPPRPKQRGNSKNYKKLRLQREFPEIAARAEAGELSWSKAYVAAGLEKKKIRIEFSENESGAQIAERLKAKLTSRQLTELCDELNNYPLEECHG